VNARAVNSQPVKLQAVSVRAVNAQAVKAMAVAVTAATSEAKAMPTIVPHPRRTLIDAFAGHT
jgi:stage V sporulation protein SpoVS